MKPDQFTKDYLKTKLDSPNFIKIEIKGIEILASRIPSLEEIERKAKEEGRDPNAYIEPGSDMDETIKEMRRKKDPIYTQDKFELFFPQIELNEIEAVELGIDDQVIAYRDPPTLEYFLTRAIAMANEGRSVYYIYQELRKNYQAQIEQLKDSAN